MNAGDSAPSTLYKRGCLSVVLGAIGWPLLWWLHASIWNSVLWKIDGQSVSTRAADVIRILLSVPCGPFIGLFASAIFVSMLQRDGVKARRLSALAGTLLLLPLPFIAVPVYQQETNTTSPNFLDIQIYLDAFPVTSVLSFPLLTGTLVLLFALFYRPYPLADLD